MAAINPTRRLAQIRHQIDIQQQVVSELELLMQQLIIGNVENLSLGQVVDDIADIYDQGTNGEVLADAFFDSFNSQDSDFNVNDDVDQEAVRQMLLQARALLGELRIEEQAWNQEAQAVKNSNKELIDQAKA